MPIGCVQQAGDVGKGRGLALVRTRSWDRADRRRQRFAQVHQRRAGLRDVAWLRQHRESTCRGLDRAGNARRRRRGSREIRNANARKSALGHATETSRSRRRRVTLHDDVAPGRRHTTETGTYHSSKGRAKSASRSRKTRPPLGGTSVDLVRGRRDAVEAGLGL